MIRILVADDHPVVRQGISQIIASAGDMLVADEAADGRELLEGRILSWNRGANAMSGYTPREASGVRSMT